MVAPHSTQNFAPSGSGLSHSEQPPSIANATRGSDVTPFRD